jgi:hypothetical protein
MTICFPRDREDPRTAGRSSVMDAWKRFSLDAATERRLAQDFTSEDKHSTGRRRKHPRSRHGGRTATRTGSPSTPSNQETHPSRRPTSVRHTDPRITAATRSRSRRERQFHRARRGEQRAPLVTGDIEGVTTYRPLVTGSAVIVGSTEKNLCVRSSHRELHWCRLVGQVPCAPLGSDIGCEVTPHLKSKDFQSALRMRRLS